MKTTTAHQTPRNSTQLCLNLPRNIGIVDISTGVPPQSHTELSKTTLAAPSLESESPCHIGAIQKGAARPDLAVVSPALLNPMDFGVAFAELFHHEPRSCGGLAFEEAGFQGYQNAAADEHESHAIVVALFDKGSFAFCHVVQVTVRSHEGDI